MKNLLIIYPHWVPSNLAGVHRPRLIANFTHEFGWHPIVLTVKPEYFEEEPDPVISRTASEKIEVIYTEAYKVTATRLIGDIGLRAFPFLYKAAVQLIKSRRIDFIWIPIPSFYTALLGRILNERTGVPYGIDYIDPWVRDISNRNNLRAKLSLLAAKVLEPIAVKKASLISGVSTAYYEPVLERNFGHHTVKHVGMPYGFDPNDHDFVLDTITYPWENNPGVLPMVYAGAFLPNSHLFVKALFSCIRDLIGESKWHNSRQLYFLGTGNYTGTSVAEYAKAYGVDAVVHEIRERFPYLHVLNFLSAADTVMVIGSTEKHYTASKTYQALLCKKPVFAMFHEESSAVRVLKEAAADALLVTYREGDREEELKIHLREKLLLLQSGEVSWRPDLQQLEKYSARASAKALVDKLNELL